MCEQNQLYIAFITNCENILSLLSVCLDSTTIHLGFNILKTQRKAR